VKTRQLEMQASSKALAILSSDDAKDLFGRSISLLQTRSVPQSMGRTRASKLLAELAKKSHNPRLATLAYRVKFDPFAPIKKALKGMIEDIRSEKEEDAKKKDFCIDELNTNQLQTENEEREKQDLTAHIEDLTDAIKRLTDVINRVKTEISENQIQLKRAGEDRELQNKEFQATVADQRATQKLLAKALKVLKGFYDKKAAALVQERQPAGPPPPSGFKTYEKNQASGGVMGMITQIIEDAKAMEAEAIKAEGDAQKAYESFVAETSATIEEKAKHVINMSEEKAKFEAELVLTQEGLASTISELEELAKYKAELHKNCDFVLENFESMQAGQDEEIEALQDAMKSMAGSEMGPDH